MAEVSPRDVQAELAVAASVHRIPDADLARISRMVNGTYRMLGQLAVESCLSEEEAPELPLSWVVDRWLADQKYCGLRDPSPRYEQVWLQCKARFPYYGVGRVPIPRPDPGPKKGGCAIV